MVSLIDIDMNILRLTVLGGLAVLVFSCYKIEDKKLNALEPIEVSVMSDTINVNIGEKLVYTGLKVNSTKNVKYEWVYGPLATGTVVADHLFQSKTVISDKPTIDYSFPKIGTYILRLRLDNDESVVYKYFTLNVNSGYDEGVLILNNDDSGLGALTFIKTLTVEEQLKGEKEIYDDIFFAEGQTLRNGRDLFMSNHEVKKVPYAGLLVATSDDQGRLYHFEPKTMELYSVSKFAEFSAAPVEFGGEYSGSGAFSTYVRTDKGTIFRYDMQLGYIQEMTDFTENGPILRNFAILNKNSPVSLSTRAPFMFSDSTVYTRSSASVGTLHYTLPGYEVVNMSAKRAYSSTNAAFALFRSKSDPKAYKIMSTDAFKSRKWKEVTGFTSESLKMDTESKFVTTTASADVYYTFDNAIYRWGLSTAPSSVPVLNVPEKEVISCIATNFMGKAADAAGEDLLYVATYNDSRSGEKKGSLYVYRFSDNTLVKSYEGICNRPVAVLYKYRLK